MERAGCDAGSPLRSRRDDIGIPGVPDQRVGIRSKERREEKQRRLQPFSWR